MGQIFTKATSPEELASFIGCDERFIYGEIARGRLKARKLSRKMIRLLPEDVESWLSQAATPASAKNQEAIEVTA